MKIAIICPDFRKSNIRKLPWKYIFETAKYLSRKHEVMVITDSNKKDVDEIEIFSVKKLFDPFKGETEELLNILNKENPDKCIMLLGLTSFLRREFKINIPVTGIFTSPLYSIKDLIKNIGVKDSIKYHKYTYIHYLNALIPNALVKNWVNKFDKIIFLSEYTQKKLISKGLRANKSVLIPSGLDQTFKELPDIKKVEKIRNDINSGNVPLIMYFTSPLTLRGTDTLVKAFAKVRKKMPCKLIFLSRMDHKELLKEETLLKELARKEGILNSMEIISKYLDPEEIKEYLRVADVVCLPFKIVISDIPVSIIEAMAVERPVISTDVACIPTILNNRGITVEPNNPGDLADGINQILNDNDLKNKLIKNSSDYIEKYPNWDYISNKFTKIESG